MPLSMPQLSPMLGFVMFIAILSSYLVLMCSLSKKTPFVLPTQLSKKEKMSFSFLNNKL